MLCRWRRPARHTLQPTASPHDPARPGLSPAHAHAHSARALARSRVADIGGDNDRERASLLRFTTRMGMN
ncbi:hypothetical protein RR48_14705 [Papilio machaon]|uniref:Uncharacterized protein n=1 Tax=Papilio machaon TaxID=76193 RepID=A0A194QL12_PAPMA|nr:hypothetical protein RR48_14705 [Papilio machaon]